MVRMHSGGYKGFGSFHSEDVEELVRVPVDTYVAPKIPSELQVYLQNLL